MKNTVLICGHGPGISHALARRFGKAGYPVALIARNARRLADAVAELTSEGMNVRSFPADVSKNDAIRSAITDAREMLGPIGILHWNAFLDTEGDLLSTLPEELNQSFSTRVTGYITAVQECLTDLVASKGAVLATSGIMALDTPQINAFATQYAALAIGVAAQHKATNLLVQTLAPHGIYVGEIIVNGFVTGTPGGDGESHTIAPEDVAKQFWELYTARQVHSVIIGKTVSTTEVGYDD